MSENINDKPARHHIKYVIRQNRGSLQYSIYEVRSNGIETFMGADYSEAALGDLKLRLDAFARVFNLATDLADATNTLHKTSGTVSPDALNLQNGNFACKLLLDLLKFKQDSKMLPPDCLQKLMETMDLKKYLDAPKSGS